LPTHLSGSSRPHAPKPSPQRSGHRKSAFAPQAYCSATARKEQSP
jgi:hypothetical protein